MTVGKAGLLTAGLVAMVTLGVVMAPSIHDSWSKMTAPHATAAAPAADSSAASAAAPVKAARTAPRARTHAAAAARNASNSVRTVPVSLWEPELRDRVKDVLNPGTHLELAAADFGDAEQFITVAHAARNTNVPFVVLKDRVLNQRQTLTEAIHELKPGLDAKAEVTHARAQAKSDWASGN